MDRGALVISYRLVGLQQELNTINTEHAHLHTHSFNGSQLWLHLGLILGRMLTYLKITEQSSASLFLAELAGPTVNQGKDFHPLL